MEHLLHSVAVILLYFLICASSALLLRRFTAVPHEVFRKLLHLILLGSLGVWTFVFDRWWHAVLSALAFAALVYPLLALAERLPGFSHLLTERRTGEIKQSLLVVFAMYAVVVCICWGWVNDRLLALASIYAWGFGDAAAALVGKRFGRHKIHLAHTDGRKSAEGSTAMFLVSLISVGVLLLLRGGLSPLAVAVTAGITALVSAAAELYSRDGFDTVICPLCAMVTLLPLVSFFGGLV